jgi:hypothetical protein
MLERRTLRRVQLVYYIKVKPKLGPIIALAHYGGLGFILKLSLSTHSHFCGAPIKKLRPLVCMYVTT